MYNSASQILTKLDQNSKFKYPFLNKLNQHKYPSRLGDVHIQWDDTMV